MRNGATLSGLTAFFQHSYYIGNYMSGILYGVELVLYGMTMSNLLKVPSRRQSRKTLMAYSTTLLFLLIIDISTNAVWGEQIWITFRDQPGGVPAFIANDLSVWYQALGSSSAVALVFLGDALLIYRCFILLGSNFWIIVVPVLMYTAGFVLSVLELVASFVPHRFFLASKATQFSTPYYALTISMNALVTLLICSRLFTLRRQMRMSMGIERAQLYTNVIHLEFISILSHRLDLHYLIVSESNISNLFRTSLFAFKSGFVDIIQKAT